MKSAFQIICFLFLHSVIHSQNGKIDSICLNFLHQESSINEAVSENIKFNLIKSSEINVSGLTLFAEVLEDTYLLISDWALKQDTIFVRDNLGYIVNIQIIRGTNHISVNKLTIRNNSDSAIFVPIEDNKLVMIQEAKDSLGNWKPIEHFLHSDCGNSYSSFTIPPNNTYELKFAKFCGDYKTKIRIRLSINHKEYLSNEFEGNINYEQFIVPERILKSDFIYNQLFNKKAYR